MFPIKYNQSIDLQCKSIDWFLYDREHWSLMGCLCRLLHYKFHKNCFWSLADGTQYVNDECWNITGMNLKFVYLVKLLKKLLKILKIQATLRAGA